MGHILVACRASALAFLLAACSAPRDAETTESVRIVAPGVGQGSGTLVLAGGRAVAFDAGPESSAVLLERLRAEGVERIEALVVSHWDLDHVGGLDALVDAGVVEMVLHGGEPVDAWTRSRKESWCGRIPSGCVQVREGVRVDVLGGLVLEALRADPDAPDENSRSLVTRLVGLDGRGLLLAPGDLDTTGEAALLSRRPDLRAQVLLVGHHGSRGSSSLPFLGAISPSVALVQAGTGNVHGHPHREALERLRTVVPDTRIVVEGMTETVMK